MMLLSEFFSILGMPQLASAPVYFDPELLALAAIFVWLITDTIIEELDRRRMEHSEQWLRMLSLLLERN